MLSPDPPVIDGTGTTTANQATIASVTDGLSNTLAVVETSGKHNATACFDGGSYTSSFANEGAWYSYVNSRQYWSSSGSNAGDRSAYDPGPWNVTTIRWGVNGAGAPFDGTDGTTGAWGSQNVGPNSMHTGGANVLRCDGSVVFLTNGMSYNVLMYLAIRDDGQAVSNP